MSQNETCICGAETYAAKKIFQNINGYDIVKCINCGQIFTSPFPTTLMKVHEIYNNDTLIKNNKNQIDEYNNYARFNLSDFFEIEGKNMLDVGPGGGETLNLAKEMGMNVECLEINPILVDYLRKQGFVTYTSIDEIPANKYDYVLMTMILEHVEKPLDFIINIKSKISKNGILRINVPNWDSIPRRIFQKYWNPICPNEHIWFWTEETLGRLLDTAEMDIIKVHCDSLGKGITKNGKVTYIGFKAFINPLGNVFMQLFIRILFIFDIVTMQEMGNQVRKLWDSRGDQLTIIAIKR